MTRATMEAKTLIILLFAIFSTFNLAVGGQAYRGGWKLLKRSIGISAMHMALLPNDRIVTFDRTDIGPTNITLPKGKCKQNMDCYAHSVEFDPSNRNVRPLTILSDTWCSSGALSPDGVLIQTGGTGFGERVVRYFKPCVDCDWTEHPNGLLSPRWYASNQILPDGKIIVVGGRFQFSYEFIPKTSSSDSILYQLPFLKETTYKEWVLNNLYPFLHLSPDGNLFIFANDRAILLDYVKNKVVRNYPVMPGGVARNYPSTGSSALLPLKLSVKRTPDAEVFICGGTSPDSNEKAIQGIFLPATKTCGRLIITAANPKWVMEEMPTGRVMGDMILLPTGDVLIINGAAKGSAGWFNAIEPVLNPVLYQPGTITPTRKFEILAPSTIPRLYHSTAHLLSDGRVLVAGSNPNNFYNFTHVVYPTELSLEAFYPPYLRSGTSRPIITWLNPAVELGYKMKFSLGFQQKMKAQLGNMYITMVAPSFTSHSYSMHQRVLVLAVDGVRQISVGKYAVEINAPATAVLAPPGYYQLFVVHEGIPSRGKWVHIK